MDSCMIHKFTVSATRERFMEPPLKETMEYYIAADYYDQAHDELFRCLNNGGWKVDKVTHTKVPLIDIRS